MKRTALTSTIISGLIVSLVFGVLFIQLVKANGIPIRVVLELCNEPPIIIVESPLNDKLFSSNTVAVSFTLTRPSYNWTSSKGTSSIVVYANITVDGTVYSRVYVYSDLRVPFSYSLNLTDLQNGAHSLQLDACCLGVETSQFNIFPAEETRISYETSSDVVSFTVDTPEPTPELESLPTSLVMASSIIVAVVLVGLSLLVYGIKRK